MSTHPIVVVFQKEMTDALRDTRSLFGTLFYPLLGPLLLLLMFSVMGRETTRQTEQPLVLPVAGAENAPNLIAFLEQEGAVIHPAPADPEAAVRRADVDVVLIIPDTYPAEFSAGRPATVRLVLDDSRQSASVTTQRVRRLLSAYGQQIGALRLLARGVSPAVGNAVAVAVVDVATPQSQAALFLNMLPFFVIFAAFTGGIGVTIDATAGERERQTLEPLVTNPVPRWQLVAGKLLASLVFTVVSIVECLLAFGLLLTRASVGELNVNLQVAPSTLWGVFWLVAPLIPLALGLQFIIASFTRSFKEAQTYLSVLPLLPSLPGMFLAFLPLRPAAWHMLLPTFGQQLLVNQLMRGEPVNSSFVALAGVVALVVGAGLLLASARLYEGEQVLFAH